MFLATTLLGWHQWTYLIQLKEPHKSNKTSNWITSTSTPQHFPVLFIDWWAIDAALFSKLGEFITWSYVSTLADISSY